MTKTYTLAENIFLIAFGVTFILLAIFWIAFARISMARIERDIKRDLDTRPAKWDGIGARAVWYSHAIVVPLGKWNLPNDPLFAVETVRKYARPKDKTLGFLFMISGYSLLVVVIAGWLMGIY